MAIPRCDFPGIANAAEPALSPAPASDRAEFWGDTRLLAEPRPSKLEGTREADTGVGPEAATRVLLVIMVGRSVTRFVRGVWGVRAGLSIGDNTAFSRGGLASGRAARPGVRFRRAVDFFPSGDWVSSLPRFDGGGELMFAAEVGKHGALPETGQQRPGCSAGSIPGASVLSSPQARQAMYSAELRKDAVRESLGKRKEEKDDLSFQSTFEPWLAPKNQTEQANHVRSVDRRRGADHLLGRDRCQPRAPGDRQQAHRQRWKPPD